MGMDKTEITAAELADILRTSTDTLRKRWSRNFPGQSFNASAVLSPEQRAVLSGGRGHKKHKASTGVSGGRRAKVSAPSPDNPPAERSADWLLDFINYFEIAAAFTGFCLLFDWVGVAPGLICAAFYAHSMAVLKRPGAWESAMLARGVCFVIAGVFGWVHFQTLAWALAEYRPDIAGAFWVALSGAALLSGISLMALYQSQNVKTDKQ